MINPKFDIKIEKAPKAGAAAGAEKSKEGAKEQKKKAEGGAKE